jgi:hypothetical protein
MANIKISQLTAAAAASDTQEFEVNDSLSSKKVTGAQVKAYVKSGFAASDITGLTASATELNVLDNIASNGLVARTGAGTGAARTITGTSNQITVTNGDGASGNPTIAAVIASQAEAEAGTDTTKLMTPQRVSQAVSALASGGMTLLGTLTTTSGTSQTISSLTLTNYRAAYFELASVTRTGGSASEQLRFDATNGTQFSANFNAGTLMSGFAWVSLVNGSFFSHVSTSGSSTTASALFAGTAPSGMAAYYGRNTLTTSSTSITVAISGGTFNGGSIRIYGVK